MAVQLELDLQSPLEKAAEQAFLDGYGYGHRDASNRKLARGHEVVEHWRAYEGPSAKLNPTPQGDS